MDYSAATLEKALRVTGCPFCNVLEDWEFDYLTKLQYDVTNSREKRMVLAEANRFCNFHFWMFKRIASAKTNALLLTAIAEHLSENNLPLNDKAPCYICELLKSTEEQMINDFVKQIHTPEFQNRYAASDGLCFPHLKRALEACGGETVKKFLVDTERQQVESLKQLLSVLMKESYYRTSPEERSSIPRLIGKLVGMKGIRYLLPEG